MIKMINAFLKYEGKAQPNETKPQEEQNKSDINFGNAKTFETVRLTNEDNKQLADIINDELQNALENPQYYDLDD